MKCPLKFRLQQFEGGEECDPDCAWLVQCGNWKACAMSVQAAAIDRAGAYRGITITVPHEAEGPGIPMADKYTWSPYG